MTGLPRRNRRRGRRRGRDDGSATGWALLTVAALLLLAAAILDGGTAMAARVHAVDLAQQAARAGANQLDLTQLRTTGQLRLDPAAARTAARAFLRRASTGGTVTATTAQVTVTVTRTQPTLLLPAIGIRTITVAATATATPVSGP
jgi:Flp pilus assembly protein TadG